MTAISRIRTSAALSAVLIAVATTTALVASSYTPKFFNDDPLWVEPETQDASGIKPNEVNLFVDLTANLLRGTRATVPPGRARNINTVDEVPNSSWFTNRGELTPERIATGPNTTAGPVPGTWTVISSKSDGVTPGFTVADAQGQRWFLKFDPRGFRGMSTGTEVAVSRLMWALGYNVAENHIAYMRREQLAIGAAARFMPPNGNKRALREADIDALLSRVDREADGSYRVVASKALAGKPIGRIRFVGTRPDDPNDLVPHQDRRELRGYGVFAAWLNHVDAKAINSLDTLVTENGRSYVRHNLVDFGSALGSGGVAPADYWAGSEYLMDARQTGKQMIGFGFVFPKWHTTPFYESRSIGRLPLQNAEFNPETWKPRVPNPAFMQARADDKFWAAQKLSAMSTELIRAAVAAGQFNDQEAEDFLVRALAARRDAILRAYLPTVNPIVAPALDEAGTLRFRNPAVEEDLARAPRGYRATWATFDNATRTTRHMGESANGTTDLQAPSALPRSTGSFVKVQVSAVESAQPTWHQPVNAYFRLRTSGWQLVGFERMPEERR